MIISLTRFCEKGRSIDSINFDELRQKQSIRRWSKTPTPKQLLASDDTVLFTHHSQNVCFKIMISGYVLAEYLDTNNTMRHSVIPTTQDCVYYPDNFGCPIKMPILYFLSMPFINALIILLDFRIENNANSRSLYHSKAFIDLSGNYYEAKKQGVKKLRIIQNPPLDNLVNKLSVDNNNAEIQRLHTAMQHLTPDQLEVIKLYFWHNMTKTEIAVALNLSYSSVRDRYNGALKKLRKNMQI